MGASYPLPPGWVLDALKAGLVIPAHPLALKKNGKLDERSQRALTRYYHAAGAGGLAVGVHTTQFAIHDKKTGLLEPVLQLAADTLDACDLQEGRRTVRIAGIIGKKRQSLSEAKMAHAMGYHAGLLSLSAFRKNSEEEMLSYARAVALEIPLIGFYLQPAVGGRVLSESFWARFAEIPNVIAIKIAPFNRYHTLDVFRGVIASGRHEEVALYTGNDDSIIQDLLTTYAVQVDGIPYSLGCVGGLLGHWACWTRSAVEHLELCKKWRWQESLPTALLTLGMQVTECNAAFFDAKNDFAGCIAGIHEVLYRQGLMTSTRCLDPNEGLSPGQREMIDRAYRSYPHLNDDAFVAEHRDKWVS